MGETHLSVPGEGHFMFDTKIKGDETIGKAFKSSGYGGRGIDKPKFKSRSMY